MTTFYTCLPMIAWLELSDYADNLEHAFREPGFSSVQPRHVADISIKDTKDNEYERTSMSNPLKGPVTL